VPARSTAGLPNSDASAPRSHRSHTAEALAPILAAGPHVERRPHDFAAAEARRAQDVEIHEVGKSAKMPWEADGRRWHTENHVGRNGEICRWDGQILARVVDRIHELGEFSDTDWSTRGVVEIRALKKSDGWFFHAITLEQWILKLKFRVARATFKREDLIARIGLKSLNELEHLPIYGNDPRVKCKNLRGPFQEVQINVHSLAEIDHPEFWSFLTEAVAGFQKFTHRIEQKPEDVMPWKVLGRKWHFARKGFPPGKRILWEAEVLEELCELLSAAAPAGQFLWNNQQLVHVFVAGQREPWASIHTKRLASVDLQLTGPKGRFALGRLTDFGCERNLDATRPEFDLLQLSFRSLDDLHQGNLASFLVEHLATVGTGNGQAAAMKPRRLARAL
jgi:excinuclease ABC subunit A